MQDLNLNPADVTLLAGEVVHADQNGAAASVNEIIQRLPETLPNSAVISSAGIPCNPDRLHFTSQGLRELGRRYAVKMLSAWVLPRRNRSPLTSKQSTRRMQLRFQLRLLNRVIHPSRPLH